MAVVVAVEEEPVEEEVVSGLVPSRILEGLEEAGVAAEVALHENVT